MRGSDEILSTNSISELLGLYSLLMIDTGKYRRKVKLIDATCGLCYTVNWSIKSVQSHDCIAAKKVAG